MSGYVVSLAADPVMAYAEEQQAEQPDHDRW